MRALQRVVEDRRALVEDRVRLTNRLTNALKAYFPQAVDWFRDKETAIFADWACPTFLRQTFVEWVGQTMPRSFWAGAFYKRHKRKGASHNAAIRALAFKLSLKGAGGVTYGKTQATQFHR